MVCIMKIIDVWLTTCKVVEASFVCVLFKRISAVF